MGDYYQTVADLDADAQSAKDTVMRLRDWMVSQQIIVAEASDCVLCKIGHAPGKNYTLATEEPYPFLFQMCTNGVAFIAERTVFYSMGVAEPTLVCSTCGKRSPAGDTWSNALGEWQETGQGMLACPHCNAKFPITEWQHDPPWAFGYVGVEFWNWPRLRADFVKELGQVVGHRCRLVYGTL